MLRRAELSFYRIQDFYVEHFNVKFRIVTKLTEDLNAEERVTFKELLMTKSMNGDSSCPSFDR